MIPRRRPDPRRCYGRTESTWSLRCPLGVRRHFPTADGSWRAALSAVSNWEGGRLCPGGRWVLWWYHRGNWRQIRPRNQYRFPSSPPRCAEVRRSARQWPGCGRLTRSSDCSAERTGPTVGLQWLLSTTVVIVGGGEPGGVESDRLVPLLGGAGAGSTSAGSAPLSGPPATPTQRASADLRGGSTGYGLLSCLVRRQAAVRTIGRPFITTTLCSKFATAAPSTVARVQPSAAWAIRPSPVVMCGSMASTCPSVIRVRMRGL